MSAISNVTNIDQVSLLDYLNKKSTANDKSSTDSTISCASAEPSILDYITNDNEEEDSTIGSVDNGINTAFSNMAKFANAVATLDSSEKTELKAIFEAAQKQMKNGTFDADKLADAASDDLKKALIQQGISLNTALSDMNSLYQTSNSSSSSDYSSLFSSASKSLTQNTYKLMTKILEKQLGSDTDDTVQ